MPKINFFKKRYNEIAKELAGWSDKNHFQLVVFNLIVVMLFLLHSVGYFSPFFPITINFIVLLSLIISAFIFRLGSKHFFIIALFFFCLASIFKLMQVEAWVERTSVYIYQSFILGMVVLLLEGLWVKRSKK